MKSDAVIVGAELDGLIAAMRLLEYGRTVRIFSAGSGSLHYSPGGIRVLGYSPAANEETVSDPLQSLSLLHDQHPYRILERGKTQSALNWFVEATGKLDHHYRANGLNSMAVSPAGLALPTYATLAHQATFEELRGMNAALIRFEAFRELPVDLLASELARAGHEIVIVDHKTPGHFTENMALAKSFDNLADPEGYFSELKHSLPDGVEVVLFPAVLGLHEHDALLAVAEQVLGARCLEVATLPPSVPGVRLTNALETHLLHHQALFHTGAEVVPSEFKGGRCTRVVDQAGRAFEASVIVVSTGGTLMGGLEVDSRGRVHETALGLDVYQTEPLNALSVDRSLDALHEAGVETDASLRPRLGSESCENIFVTGRTLAHWNPAQECSAEGVCIATGWAAAEAAQSYLGGGS